MHNPKNVVFFGFFVYALALGSMFPRLSDLQQALDIDKATLGFALIGLPVGVQLTLLSADRLVRRIGLFRIMAYGIPLIAGSQCLVALANTPLFFFLFLTLGGVGVALIEVAVNLEADRVEAHTGQRIMNRSHAFWSFGFFGAGFIGSALAQLGVQPFLHFALIALLASAATLYVFLNYSPAPSRHQYTPDAGFSIVIPSRGVMLLVAFTVSAMLVEGSSIDWSVIFMRESFDAAPFTAGLSLTLAALSQAITRYFADPLVERFSASRVCTISILVMALGVALVSFSTHQEMALVGFFLMGAGSAVIFPLSMSAAAQRTDRSAEENVAALAQFAFVIFLFAPPILGFIGEILGLRWAFALAFPLLVLSYFSRSAINVLDQKTPN